MSIYRRPRVIAENDVTAPVVPDAEHRFDAPRPAPRTATEFLHLRKSNPVNVVLPAGRRWMESLPPHVRPVKLAAQFPRIVNLIALEWDRDAAIARLFSDLLLDRRGGRAGFPTAIMQELHALRDHRYNRPGRAR
jgi:hypothetical protein